MKRNVNILPIRKFIRRALVYAFFAVSLLLISVSKIFASFYALHCGVVFLSTVAIFFAPFAHRLMHMLLVDSDDEMI